MRIEHAIAGAIAVALAVTLAAPRAAVEAETARPVQVVNLPDVQEVTGRVVVAAPVPATRFESRRAIVTPAPLTETNLLTEVGRLDTAGWATVTLGVAGQMQGTPRSGAVGVVLVPDVPEIVTAFTDHGTLRFALRLEAAVEPVESGLFQSPQETFRLAFPRYRVFFYNATGGTTDTSLYANLGMS